MEKTIRIVTRGRNGEIRSKDYPHTTDLLKMHTQIGIDDCSTDLSLRGLPVFRGLIGPMPDGKGIVRYESPEVFETLTKEWGAPPPKRKRIRKKATTVATPTAESIATPIPSNLASAETPIGDPPATA